MPTLPLLTGPTCRCTIRVPPYKWKLNIPSFLQSWVTRVSLIGGGRREGVGRGKKEERGKKEGLHDHNLVCILKVKPTSF